MRALALVLSLLAAAPAFAGYSNSDIGTSTAQFLKLGAGARAEGMGEACTAVIDDADAMYWNPAALSRIEQRSATMMLEALPAQINYEFMGYGQSLGRAGAIGGSIQYLDQPTIDQTDASGFNTGATFHPADMAVSGGYAYTIRNPNLGLLNGASFGATAKFISETITHTEDSVGFDLGYLSPAYQVFDHDFRVAYAVQDLGKPMRFAQLNDPLPTTLRLGLSYELAPGWLLAGDFDEPLDNGPYAALGTEYTIQTDKGSFSGRMGVNTRSISQTGDFSGLSFGVGARLKQFGVDYAFTAMGELGLTQYVSLSFKF